VLLLQLLLLLLLLLLLQVWHDGGAATGGGGACKHSPFNMDERWFLSRITVEALPYGSVYEATFNKWVHSGRSKAANAPLELKSGSKHPSQTPEGSAAAAAASRQQVRCF
jgi:hypothetical protein